MISNIEKYAEMQTALMANTGKDADDLDLIYIGDEASGTCIINPFTSVCGRFSVDPVKEYGAEEFRIWRAQVEERLKS